MLAGPRRSPLIPEDSFPLNTLRAIPFFFSRLFVFTPRSVQSAHKSSTHIYAPRRSEKHPLEHFAFETLPSALYGETQFRLRLMGGRRCIRPAARAISF
jgi:hypothetical protein